MDQFELDDDDRSAVELARVLRADCCEKIESPKADSWIGMRVACSGATSLLDTGRFHGIRYRVSQWRQQL